MSPRMLTLPLLLNLSVLAATAKPAQSISAASPA